MHYARKSQLVLAHEHPLSLVDGAVDLLRDPWVDAVYVVGVPARAPANFAACTIKVVGGALNASIRELVAADTAHFRCLHIKAPLCHCGQLDDLENPILVLLHLLIHYIDEYVGGSRAS